MFGSVPDNFVAMKINHFRRHSRGDVSNPARSKELLPYPKSKPQDDLEGRNPPTLSRRRDHSNRRVDRDADCSSSKIPKPSLSPLRPRNELFWIDLLGLDRVLYELQQYGILGSESYNGPVCFNCCGCHSLSCCPEEKVERVIRRNVALFRKTIKPTTM